MVALPVKDPYHILQDVLLIIELLHSGGRSVDFARTREQLKSISHLAFPYRSRASDPDRRVRSSGDTAIRTNFCFNSQASGPSFSSLPT